MTPPFHTEQQRLMAQNGIQRVFKHDDKKDVVNYIKTEIKRSASVNITDACDAVFKGKPFSGEISEIEFYESVSAMLVNSGEYLREKSDSGFNILLNPAYYHNRSVKRISWTAVIISTISLLIAILTYYTNVTWHTQQKQQTLQQTTTK